VSLLDALIGNEVVLPRETFAKSSPPLSPPPPLPVTEVTEVATPIEKSLTDLGAERTAVPIPAGAILLSRRYNGGSKPVPAVPKCWCCQIPYEFEHIQKARGKTYAFVEPACRCLDVWTCCRCFACRAHCRCGSKTDTGTAPKTPQEVFRTPNRDGGA
jgi:hypothetical protein